jgi:hypothetical protein
MDDQTRSIIRNVKGPGMTTFSFYDPGGMRIAKDRWSGWDHTEPRITNDCVPQSVRMTSFACSSPSVRPAVSGKRDGRCLGEAFLRRKSDAWEFMGRMLGNMRNGIGLHLHNCS